MRHPARHPAHLPAAGGGPSRAPLALASGALALLLLACSSASAPGEGTRAVQLRFAAKVGNEAFACTRTYDGVGTSRSTIAPLDFRLYVRDVKLVRAGGEAVPLALVQDGKWQRDAVALLDFEDGSGTCQTGSPDTRRVIEGSAPDFDDYVGVTFTIGLPDELNHLDGATAPPPLNVPGMWWSWAGGYKFIRLDVSTAKNPSFFFHLGNAKCTGTPATGFSCANVNRPEIRLSPFRLDADAVTVDLADFYAGIDVDAAIDGQSDRIPGCMAGPTDPECGPMMGKLGLDPEKGFDPARGQTFFRVEALP
jgi:uncharacterized repeat protein (TIGR04052 family)